MINFFRKIRQKLLSEGNSGKPAWPVGRYLKYAIGEIVLVVIGILIALQINNWNQKNINEKKLTLYIESMLKDLDLDKARLIECFVADSTKAQTIDSLSDPLPDFFSASGNPLEVDSLLWSYSIEIHNATYNSMISSNALELLENDEIQNEISKYYSSMEQSKRFEDWYVNNSYPLFLEFLSHNQDASFKEITPYLAILRQTSINESRRYRELIDQNNQLKDLLAEKIKK